MSSQPISRVAVAGLRRSDATSLSIMVQDLLRQNLARLEAGTLADLFALSEAEDQLPKPMVRDLQAFAMQKIRELRDLPDGEPLQEFLKQLEILLPRRVPESLRQAVRELNAGDRLLASTAALVARLEGAWAEATPEDLVIPTRATPAIQRPAVPERLQVPEERSSRPRATSAGPRPRPTPAAQRDVRRSTWIREDILDRLNAHRERGLKESVILAGARHRSPYADLTDAEIMAELRTLKNSGEIRLSAGRWIRVKRLGW